MKVWLRSVACGLVLLWALVARAHDGLYGPDMLAEVNSAQAVGNTVQLEVLVINLGGPLVLTGLRAEGATSIRLEPIYFNFAEEVAVSSTLQFGAPPPSVFTLMLDFGVLGQGAVTVKPDR